MSKDNKKDIPQEVTQSVPGQLGFLAAVAVFFYGVGSLAYDIGTGLYSMLW